MRIPKRGERGFTLIELLIVVAILGVLAAVVIPNVGRFIGRGEEEAKDTEFTNVQTSVIAMMTDNKLESLPNPVLLEADRTNIMGAFPDPDSAAGSTAKKYDPNGNEYFAGVGLDLDGFVLYQHDIIGNSANTSLVNYVATSTTAYWYTVDALGTVTQWDTAAP